MRLLFTYLMDTLARLFCGHPTYKPPSAESSSYVLLLDLRFKLVGMCNDLRRIKGKNLRPLSLYHALSQVAQDHAEWMARNHSVEHEQPQPMADVKKMEAGDGVFLPPIDFVSRVFQTYGFFIEGGQLLACGPPEPFELMCGWKNNDSYCDLILNPHFRHCGFGVAKDETGRLYWCALFVHPYMSHLLMPDEVGLDMPEPLLTPIS